MLHEIIPDFHNTAKRFETFEKVVKEDKVGRVKNALAEIDFILTRGEDTKKVVNLINKGELPIRVTHNDTKFNNIMIDDKSGMKKLAIIGRCQINSETNDLWDYLGCLYPEGVLGEDMNFLFNKEDIDNVIFEGYKDSEETEFLVKLEDLCKEYKK